jgi:hypothetical protein
VNTQGFEIPELGRVVCHCQGEDAKKLQSWPWGPASHLLALEMVCGSLPCSLRLPLLADHVAVGAPAALVVDAIVNHC